ncbi:MAG: hypothetical protein DHS80DRAFT_32346 [Piptocephalis tieghemiana]|nr:MAG: hypothetical protein DHS80DRAFT_32346 [Piptocephalis tieghemiana]
MSAFDFEKQLTFYSQYHVNKFNVFVHIVCIPAIVWSALVLLSSSGPLLDIPTGPLLVQAGLIPTASLALTLLYVAYYILLEPVAGLLYAPILLAMCGHATLFRFSHPDSLSWALYVQLFSWTAQILSHRFAEGRSPAFLDSVVQAFLLAPLFSFIEILFMLGYRPALQKRLRNDVGLAVSHFRMARAEEKRMAKAKKEQKSKAQ